MHDFCQLFKKIVFNCFKCFYLKWWKPMWSYRFYWSFCFPFASHYWCIINTKAYLVFFLGVNHLHVLFHSYTLYSGAKQRFKCVFVFEGAKVLEVDNNLNSLMLKGDIWDKLNFSWTGFCLGSLRWRVLNDTLWMIVTVSWKDAGAGWICSHPWLFAQQSFALEFLLHCVCFRAGFIFPNTFCLHRFWRTWLKARVTHLCDNQAYNGSWPDQEFIKLKV